VHSQETEAILWATETGSDRLRSYPQARRPLVSWYVALC
jgi:hypothetical protein